MERRHAIGRMWGPPTRHVERVLWCLGLAMLALYGAVRFQNELAAQQAIVEFERAGATPVNQTSDEPAFSWSSPDVSLWSDGRVKAFHDGDSKQQPSGVLRIPAIDLSVPIYAGTSDTALDRGVGWIEGTSAPGDSGNLGVAGHRDGFFRRLGDLSVGDSIVVNSTDGSLTYRVTDFHVVSPEAVEFLHATSEDAITLVTCYPFYFVGPAPQRFIVRGMIQRDLSDVRTAATVK